MVLRRASDLWENPFLARLVVCYNSAMNIHTIGIRAFNRYLVHDQGYILVDSGMSHTEGTVQRTLQHLAW